MKKSFLLLLAVVLFYAASGQNNSAPVPVVTSPVNQTKDDSSKLSNEDLARIDNLFTDYTKNYLSYDWPSCLQFYTKDAMRFSPGSTPKKGYDSILEGLKKTKKISRYEGENLEVYGSGDYAYVTRKFLMDVTFENTPQPVVLSGYTLYVLKKVDNSWKIHRVMWVN